MSFSLSYLRVLPRHSQNCTPNGSTHHESMTTVSGPCASSKFCNGALGIDNPRFRGTLRAHFLPTIFNTAAWRWAWTYRSSDEPGADCRVATADESGTHQIAMCACGLARAYRPLLEAATDRPHAVLSRSRATGAKNFF